MNKRISEGEITVEQATKFELLFGLIKSFLEEMKEFAKKQPDGILNEYKVKMINRVLKEVKELFTREPINSFLELLDDEKLPSNGDAVLAIGQFKAAMDEFKARYYGQHNDFTTGWFTKEKSR